MKDRPLIYLSLAFGITALADAIWVHRHAEQMAAEALRKREAEFVTHYAPKLTQVYSAIGDHTNVFATPPKPVEELFRPMVEMMNRLGGSQEEPASTNEGTK